MMNSMKKLVCIALILTLPWLGYAGVGKQIASANTRVYHEVKPDTWVFTDGLGRTALTNQEVGDPKTDKTAAIFYWTWHLNRIAPLNVNEAVEQYPEAIHDFSHPVWNQYAFQGAWNESIYGYYDSTDAWVVRRQSELLANAGIDAIFTDNTNGTVTFRDGYRTVFETYTTAKADGVNTPKVSFMLPFAGGSDTAVQMSNLYMDFYRYDEFKDHWFYWEGKPMLMAHDSSIYVENPVIAQEMKDFFTLRGPYSGYVNKRPKDGQWGWLSIYPQAYYYADLDAWAEGRVEQITVGTAMNHNYKLGLLAPMNGEYIMGRSYTSDYPNRYEVEGKEASKWGYNLAEQFRYALEVDPQVIFITGWNEFAMYRGLTWPEGWESAVENAFADQFNDEFSRDIEPTKGDLKDHYYYQMVNFIRQYKGVRSIPTPSKGKTIDIQKSNAQWASVGPYYAAYTGNTDSRENRGWGSLQYSDYSGRNDIIGAKIARDEENVYFYVECDNDISPYTDPLWMVLYLDTDQQNQGWESFDYVLNKTSPTATTAYLERFVGEGYETQPIGEVSYTVKDNYMQVQIPKSMLNLQGDTFTVNFAWTDNVHDAADQGEYGDREHQYTTFSGDIMDFYISGDVAPSGRFQYSYISDSQNYQTTLGDVNDDDAIDAQDALWVLQKAVGKRQLTQQQSWAGDVNRDDVINAADALNVLKKAVGKLSDL